MKSNISKKLFGFALAIVVFVNIMMLGQVYINSHSNPTSLITLTQRELPIYTYHQKDISTQYTSIRFNSENHYHSILWLDEDNLTKLGFNMNQIKKEWTGKIGRFFDTKEVFVALECDGKSYQKYLESKKQEYDKRVQEYNSSIHGNYRSYIRYAKETLEYVKTKESRLFAIDASRDFQSLRQKYPMENVMIAKALIKVTISKSPNRVQGHISKLLVPAIHLSKEHLKQIKFLEDRSVKYTIKLALGNLFMPYIVDIN
ncbi:MAG: hypothetical protein KU38_07130 [Sulfurovum sp. FS08-3]|nr:MAG: hypothetical protein KU38_07130 [Sulfurovum sp. FS08-3]